MACENCVSRREFLVTAGAAGLVAISGCGDGQVSGPDRRIPLGISGPLVILIADYPALATDNVLVKIKQQNIAVKRTSSATFDAYSMRCTHQGCSTDLVNGQTFHCQCHGSNFANDGSVINGPFTGDQIGPLETFATSYDPATDQLTIS